jgi:hypothetical protein
MDQQAEDKIIHRVVRRIADDHGCTVDEVHAVLDRHPIEVDRDKYLKRTLALHTLALQLLHLDELEEVFREKALVDRDVAAGVLLVKVAERRATLLGMNAPIGHAVAVVQPPPEHKLTGTDRIEAVLKELREMDRADEDGATH